MTRFSVPRAALGVAVAAVATVLGMSAGRAQSAGPVLPPMSVVRAEFFKHHPDAYARFLARLPQRPADDVAPTANRARPPAGGAWTAVTKGPVGLCNPLLLTDGTVIVHNCDTPYWYKLTPDAAGNYADGTWTKIASLPVIGGTQYAPQYHASAVLPDGRVVIMGGEYNGSNTGVWTNLGAIYDPVANTWTAVTAPSGSSWTQIGDAQGVVLANGTFMLASCCAYPDANALLDATTLTWTTTGAPAGGSYQDEQGYELLPSTKVLTVDIWTNYPNGNTNTAELYNPATGAWAPTGSTPVPLPDPCGTYEIGPAALRGDGSVVAFGGNSGCNGLTVDPVAVYTSKTRTWAAAPNVPSVCGSNGTTGCDLADAPAAVMPTGKILFAASSGYGDSPTHFFELGRGNAITQVADPIYNASTSGAYYYNFLALPNGQVLMTDFSKYAEVYTPTGTAIAGYGPTITKVPAAITPGSTYQVTGDQLNGLTDGAYYGDDAQMATNYPIVRITNVASGHVVYARTANFTSMSLAPKIHSGAKFTVPAATEAGASTLVVIASGIASPPVSITVN
jgi:hypothetical protein